MCPQTLFSLFSSLHSRHIETRKNEAFGSSLLLANSPMSPKVVNGSFAAIIDADEFLAKAYAGIRVAVIFFKIMSTQTAQLILNVFSRIRIPQQCDEECVEF